MAVTAKALINSQFAPNAETTLYTATSVRCLIDKFTGYNSSGSTTTLTIKIVPSGGSAATSNVMIVKSLTSGDVYTFPEISGQVLNAGDFVSVLAGAASAVVIRMSGREVS